MAAHSDERQCAVNYLNGWLGTGQTTNIRSQPPATSAYSRSTLQSCLTLSVTSKTVLLCCHLVSRSLARPLLGGLGLGLASVVFLLKSLLTTDGNSSVSRRQQITFLAIRSSSTSSMDYTLPRLRTKFGGEWAFSHAGPATWNTLPDNIRTVADPVKFRKLLKSRFS